MFEIVNVNDLNLMNITEAKILIMEPQIKYMSQAVCAIFWVPFDGVRHRAQR